MFASRYVSGRGAAAPTTGTLVVQSNPAGVQVFVDGDDHGQTPARISVHAGRAHPRAARPRRSARDSVDGHRRRRSVAHRRVRQHAGDRQPAGRVAAGGREGRRRRHRSRRRAGHRHGPGARAITKSSCRRRSHRRATSSACRRAAPRRSSRRWRRRRPTAARCPAGSSVKAPFSLEIREEGRLHRHDRRRPPDARRRPARRSARQRDAWAIASRASSQVMPGKVADAQDRSAERHRQHQRDAVGRSLGRRPARRRDADRQPVDSDRSARSGVPSPAVRREAPRDLRDDAGHDARQRWT